MAKFTDLPLNVQGELERRYDGPVPQTAIEQAAREGMGMFDAPAYTPPSDPQCLRTEIEILTREKKVWRRNIDTDLDLYSRADPEDAKRDWATVANSMAGYREAEQKIQACQAAQKANMGVAA